MIVQDHHLIGIAAECLALHKTSVALSASRHTSLVQTYFTTEGSFSHRSAKIKYQVANRLIASKHIVRGLRAMLTIKTLVALFVDGASIQATRPERHLVQGIAVATASMEYRCCYASVAYGVRLAFPNAYRIGIFLASKTVRFLVQIIIALSLRPLLYMLGRVGFARQLWHRLTVPDAVASIRGKAKFVLVLKYLCICRQI